jgi:hypothetical protein
MWLIYGGVESPPYNDARGPRCFARVGQGKPVVREGPGIFSG